MQSSGVASTIDTDLIGSNGTSSPSESQDSFAITLAPLAIEEVYDLADDPGNGAIVVMSGMVRNQTGGRPVESLEYQAYQPMALIVFEQIATEIRQKWVDANRVVIHHRVGHLRVGEISVLVAVGCSLRRDASLVVSRAERVYRELTPRRVRRSALRRSSEIPKASS